MAPLSYDDPKEELNASLAYLKTRIKSQRDISQNIIFNTSPSRRNELLKKIQEIVLNIVRSTVRNEVPSLSIRTRRLLWKDCNFDKRLTMKSRSDISNQGINLISHEKRFVMTCHILLTIYRLLLTGSSKTKREIYYEKTELFGNQTAVNAAVLDICDLLWASQWELRVLSTSKGLVAGNLSVETAQREVIDFNKPGGVLVPQDVTSIVKFKSSAKFILVVEKDAAFQKLLDDGALWRLGPCIIITGKGEPDINTRMFVCRLSRELAVPVLILVDADPYGVEIMCTYRFGSLTMIQHSAELATPEMRWVGLHPTDIARLYIPAVPFTSKDYAKARDLSCRPYIQQNPDLLEQVNWLLENGKKCEIENLTALSQFFLTDMYLPYKITSRSVI